MTIIEQIRAEIERLKPRIRKICGEEVKIPVEKVRKKFDTLLSFLDTIKEQPCEGLEEAAKRYEHNRVYQDELDKYANYLDSLEEGETPRMKEPSPETRYLLNADMIESFKAGAKWQREQNEPICEGLEEEVADFIANHYTVDNYDGVTHHGEYLDTNDVADIAHHFAQWQKEQMMKDAVEGEVESFSDVQFPEVSIPLNPTVFKVGDKVHIIIIKKD